jgi:lipoprotein-anchoring transpeptidase ErfK/SrfK
MVLDIGVDTSSVRLEVSLRDRTLWVMRGTDTLRTMVVAVASGRALQNGLAQWRFVLPRGERTVRAKRTEPVWTPPDWHYVEEARTYHLRVRALPAAGVRLRDGRLLVMRDSVVGLLTRGDPFFNPLPTDEHIVFDSTLFIPPLGSRNRRIAGELGRFALDLGEGYLVHGTRDPSSIGTATTHGCLRLADDDLEWVFANTPVGTRVRVR